MKDYRALTQRSFTERSALPSSSMFTRAIKGRERACTRCEDELAQEIVKDLEAALEQVREIAIDVRGDSSQTKKI